MTKNVCEPIQWYKNNRTFTFSVIYILSHKCYYIYLDFVDFFLSFLVFSLFLGLFVQILQNLCLVEVFVQNVEV